MEDTRFDEEKLLLNPQWRMLSVFVSTFPFRLEWDKSSWHLKCNLQATLRGGRVYLVEYFSETCRSGKEKKNTHFYAVQLFLMNYCLRSNQRGNALAQANAYVS
jgi:hypothetical protein